MTLVIIFIVSGLILITLIVSKKIGEKRKRPLFISILISRSDTLIRDLYHKVVHFYTDSKERFLFLCKRQIPIHSKNYFNKSLAFLKEKRGQYIQNMRDTKFLRKSDGISEFFKSISSVEKGGGEIHDVYEDGSQNIKEEVK